MRQNLSKIGKNLGENKRKFQFPKDQFIRERNVSHISQVNPLKGTVPRNNYNIMLTLFHVILPKP